VAELRNGQFRFFGLTIPKEYGGEGWSAIEWFTVLEELSKAYATVRLIAHTMNGLFWRPLLYFGNEEQKQKYLPRLATGEIWPANSLTEPEAGTGKDINSKAVRDGDDYIKTGTNGSLPCLRGTPSLSTPLQPPRKGATFISGGCSM
jgi:alkylation response protein AidB-like acyl-CoA dehydrogenase